MINVRFVLGQHFRKSMIYDGQVCTAAKEERIARYKEERRRQLAAQFGPRDNLNHQPPPAAQAIRSTRASRLRTQANSGRSITRQTVPLPIPQTVWTDRFFATFKLIVRKWLMDLDERRPILKAQTRRCSLEEVVKRTLSPEPQGILKRKTSSDETELPTDLFHTPHGEQLSLNLELAMLDSRNKPAKNQNTSSYQNKNNIRVNLGILKKPSVTEEPLLEALDCPRPILKKKSSSEEEEFPVKPILKVSSRKSIEDEAELTRDDIKPILKHPEDSPGVVRRPKKSAGAAEKRIMSLDLSLFARPSSGGEGRPLSVAERVNGLESLLAIKRDDYSLSHTQWCVDNTQYFHILKRQIATDL
ncbi:unnamed protein product [Nesidiocoris tenuis]|uniref:Uncharacterized protein n=1 Tax=Nesidiocoris tenuis TaxID=355587 RepID=A0A6H5FW51_9HEMI|nr:unnamed protein product [Nesidiocoris tenuis]